jgi:predicted nucleic acid-binding protein
VLVDTSIWVDHLRRRNERLAAALENGEVECHPFVIGELACGLIGRRKEILSLLRDLPGVTEVDHAEALGFI